MKVKNLFAIVLASITLFACSNDDEPNGGQVVSGKDTWAAFSIKLPKTLTRSTNDDGSNATAEETKVETVAIYIEQADGHMTTSDKGIINLADYSSGSTNNVYTAKMAIKAKTGNAKVWVVVNPTVAMHDRIMGFPANAAFHTAFPATAPDMAGGYIYATETGVTNAGFVMTNKETKEVTLVDVKTEDEAVNGGVPDDAKNHFTIEVERAVAKVAVISKKANLNDLNSLPQQGTFTDIKYYAAQINNNMLMARKTDATVQPGGANIVTPGNDDDGTNVFGISTLDLNGDPLDINPVGTAANKLNSIYLLENSMLDPQQRNATHVVVEAIWTPKTLYKADGITEFAAGEYTTGDDFWFYNSKYYGELPKELVVGSGDPNAGKGNDYKWTGGKCYYFVYLYDKYGAGDDVFYDVVRNTVYNVNLSSIKAPGVNVPTPPVGPIQQPAYVTATVEIAPWTLAAMDDVDLQ